MRKCNWNIDEAKVILHEYCSVEPIDDDEFLILKLMLQFPQNSGVSPISIITAGEVRLKQITHTDFRKLLMKLMKAKSLLTILII